MSPLGASFGDRLIFSVCYAGIRPVLCITKLDLIAENDAIHEEIQHYIDSGYEVYQSGKGYASEDLIQALKYQCADRAERRR